MISGVFTVSTVCSLEFVAVNGDNLKDLVSVHTVLWAVIDVELYHTVLWAVIDVELYRSLFVIYFNNISRFPILIFLALKSLDRQNSQTLRPQIYRHYNRKMKKIKYFK